MVSLKKSLAEYDRSRVLVSELSDTLLSTLTSMRQYVVETDPALVSDYMEWMNAAIQNVETSLSEPNPGVFGDVRTSIRGGLREYRDRAVKYIEDLKTKLAKTNAALDEMLMTLQGGDSDAEKQLKTEISRLGKLDQIDTILELRAELRRSANTLAGAMTQLKHEKDVAVAQLRDEIRTLHKSLETAKQAVSTTNVTGIQERDVFEQQIAAEMNSGVAAGVVMIKMQNFTNLASWHPRNMMEQLTNAFYKRMRGVIPDDAIVGRWRENAFCVLVHAPVMQSVEADMLRKCGGNYVCMEGSRARTLYVHVAALSIDCTGSTPETIFESLENAGVTTGKI